MLSQSVRSVPDVTNCYIIVCYWHCMTNDKKNPVSYIDFVITKAIKTTCLLQCSNIYIYIFFFLSHGEHSGQNGVHGPHVGKACGKGCKGYRPLNVKVIPQKAEVAQAVPDRLRPRIFLTFGTTMVVSRQPYAPAAFTPGEIPGTHFQGLSRPQGTWFCRGYHGKSPQWHHRGSIPGPSD